MQMRADTRAKIFNDNMCKCGDDVLRFFFFFFIIHIFVIRGATMCRGSIGRPPRRWPLAFLGYRDFRRASSGPDESGERESRILIPNRPHVRARILLPSPRFTSLPHSSLRLAKLPQGFRVSGQCGSPCTAGISDMHRVEFTEFNEARSVRLYSSLSTGSLPRLGISQRFCKPYTAI